MNELTFDIELDRTSFAPGETVIGTVRWRCVEHPDNADLQLLWYTEGKGNEDVGLVEETHFDMPQSAESRPFEFALPDGPYSFSGKLISLTWALELHVDKEFIRKEIVVSPTGEEISLHETRTS
jgi:hypothetical protein